MELLNRQSWKLPWEGGGGRGGWGTWSKVGDVDKGRQRRGQFTLEVFIPTEWNVWKEWMEKINEPQKKSTGWISTLFPRFLPIFSRSYLPFPPCLFTRIQEKVPLLEKEVRNGGEMWGSLLEERWDWSVWKMLYCICQRQTRRLKMHLHFFPLRRHMKGF